MTVKSTHFRESFPITRRDSLLKSLSICVPVHLTMTLLSSPPWFTKLGKQFGFPSSSVGKVSPPMQERRVVQETRAGSDPGSGRSPGEGNGNPLQYYCLGNPMDREAWQDTVHGVAWVRHDLASNRHQQCRRVPFSPHSLQQKNTVFNICCSSFLLPVALLFSWLQCGHM